MSDPIEMLYEPGTRLNAYYYGFDSTGDPHIDAILSAVAWAGKGWHHTEDWGEDREFGYGPFAPGQAAVDVIQETANRAAKHYGGESA